MNVCPFTFFVIVNCKKVQVRKPVCISLSFLYHLHVTYTYLTKIEAVTTGTYDFHFLGAIYQRANNHPSTYYNEVA